MGTDHLHDLARAFIAAVEQGELPDELLTPDMTGWTTTGGTTDRAGYQRVITMLRHMCAEPIRFTIDALTAQDDRVVVEARSRATLINDATYENTYVFVIRARDGRIAAVAEHYNALIVDEVLMPVVASLRRG
jgi:ketosteroid isomerase-like protein